MPLNNSLKDLDEKILRLALAALTRANTDVFYHDRGKEHHGVLAPLSAAHAGELLLKAIIAKEHPLLIFQSLTDTNPDKDVNLDWLLQHGKTHDFSKLPSILKACTGNSIPDPRSFEALRKVRNQVQHFLQPSDDLRDVAFEFIYKNIDPLLFEHFGEFAYQFHEDEFDDYIIGTLFVSEIRFSCESLEGISEIEPNEYLANCNSTYKKWAYEKMNRPSA